MAPDLAAALTLAGTMVLGYVAALRLVDLNEKEPMWALLLLVWLGIVAAALAGLIGEPTLGSESPLEVSLTAEAAKMSAILAGFGLLTAVGRSRGWSEINGPVDSLIYGAAAGVGFATGELFIRQTFTADSEIQIADQTDTLDLVWLALQAGLVEAMFGAVLGLGALALFQRPRTLQRVVRPVGAFVLAVLLHRGYCALLDSPLVRPQFSWRAAGAIGFVMLMVALAIRRALGDEKRAIIESLKHERDEEVVTQEELDLLEHTGERHRSYREKFLTGDLDGWLLQRWLQNQHVQLALAKGSASGDDGLEWRRDLIRDRRRKAATQAGVKDAAGEHDSHKPRSILERLRASIEFRWPRPGEMKVAITATLLLIGGGTLVQAAAGDEAPTTVATRSAEDEREQNEPDPAQSPPVLKDLIQQMVGPYRLSHGRQGADSMATPPMSRTSSPTSRPRAGR